MTNFAIKCEPIVGEGPEGFVIRVFETNGFFGLGQLPNFCGTHSILQAAKSLGWNFQRPPSGLSCYQDMPQNETWWRKNLRRLQGLDKSLRRKDGYRYCPACLSSQEIRLEIWNAEGFWACPTHQCYLRNSCHVCGALERGARVALASCYACGAKHADAPCSAADASTLAIARLMVSGDGEIFPPVLSDIGGLTIDAIRLFGAPNRVGVDLRRDVLSNEPELSEQTIAQWSDRSASVLCNWPDGFHGWIEERVDPDKSKVGPQRFGGWLSRVRNELGRVPAVRKAVYDYMWSRWDRVPLAGEGSYFSGETPPDHILIPRHAANLIGVAEGKIKLLIEQGKLEGRSEVRGKNTYCYVSRTSVENYITKQQQFSSANDIQERLGTRKALSRELVAAGLLELSPARKASRYLTASVDTLLSRLDDVSIANDGVLDLVRLSDISTARRVKLASLCPHILAGEISCFRVDGVGLAGFAIPLEAMLGYYYEDGVIYCSSGRVAEITGLHKGSIAGCAEAGLLERHFSPHYKFRKLFHLDSATTFHDRYIGSRELMRRTNLNYHGVTSKLINCGIRPAIEHDVSRHISSYWCRKSVAEALSANLAVNKRTPSPASKGKVLKQYLKREKRQLYDIIPAKLSA